MPTGRKLVSDVIEINKYYLYRHIRLDKNEPFYIGIGTKPKIYKYTSVEYSRAYNKSKRGFIWKKIASKTSYNVEILLESNSYDFIKQKEIEFIKLYGRLSNKTGVLSNLTDGGDGSTGYKASEETRRKISLNSYVRGKFGKNNPKSKKVYQYDLEGNFIKEWDSLADIGRIFSNGRTPTFKGKTFKGYMWKYEYLGLKINPVDYKTGINKRISCIQNSVYCYDLNGKFLEKFNSITECALKLKGSITGVHSCLQRANSRYKNYFLYNNLKK